MLLSKPKYSYANLRPQFSDDATNATNHLVTNHILQNYTFDPSLGLENYSRFSVAIKNSIELNLPCLPPFRKRQPWLDVELTNLCLQYSQSRARYISAKSPANQETMSQLDLHCLVCTLPNRSNTFTLSVTTSTPSLVMGRLSWPGPPLTSLLAVRVAPMASSPLRTTLTDSSNGIPTLRIYSVLMPPPPPPRFLRQLPLSPPVPSLG